MVDASQACKPPMQYYFVVNQFHGKEFYRVDNLERKQITHHSDGTERFPQPLKIIPIPECVAKLPLNVLISIYKNYYKSPLKIAATDSKVSLLYNIARVRLTQGLDH